MNGRGNQFKDKYVSVPDSKAVKRNEVSDFKQMWKWMERVVVDNAREVGISVSVRKNYQRKSVGIMRLKIQRRLNGLRGRMCGRGIGGVREKTDTKHGDP